MTPRQSFAPIKSFNTTQECHNIRLAQYNLPLQTNIFKSDLSLPEREAAKYGLCGFCLLHERVMRFSFFSSSSFFASGNVASAIIIASICSSLRILKFFYTLAFYVWNILVILTETLHPHINSWVLLNDGWLDRDWTQNPTSVQSLSRPCPLSV